MCLFKLLMKSILLHLVPISTFLANKKARPLHFLDQLTRTTICNNVVEAIGQHGIFAAKSETYNSIYKLRQHVQINTCNWTRLNHFLEGCLYDERDRITSGRNNKRDQKTAVNSLKIYRYVYMKPGCFLPCFVRLELSSSRQDLGITGTIFPV